MEPAHLLSFVVAVWCASFLARLGLAMRKGAPLALGWAMKAGAALAAVGAAVLAGSDTAVYGVSAAWAAFLLTPALAAQGQVRSLAAMRPDRAKRFARVVRLLHPFDGWRHAPRLMDALARARAGDPAAVDDLRAMVASGDLPAATRPHVLGDVARLTDDWAGFLRAVGDGPLPHGLEGLRLRALGETGRLPELIAAYARFDARGAPDAFADLMLFAFAGRTRGLGALLSDGPFGGLHPSSAAYWRATARLVRDPADAGARAELAALGAGPHAPSPAAVARRLDGVLGDPAGLDAAAQAVADRAERRAIDDVGRVRAAPARLAVVTWALVAANLFGFGLELWGGGPDGPTDLENLFELGALWPPAVTLGGEWWRLATALFLHFGVLHLALNMLALAVFGRIVERALGRLRMAALYAVAGLGSMAFVLALEQATGADPTLLVGASGAIFGIVGALGALLASDAAAGSRPARRRLVEIGLIVALQIGFDVMTPEVSLSAHAGGFVIGAIAGALLSRLEAIQRPT